MTNCHIAIVTLRKGAEFVMMPSKVYSAMLAGQAVIAACDRQSDLADLVADAGCGWIIDPEDEKGAWAALADAAGDLRRLADRQRRAQSYAKDKFDMKVIAERWSAMLQQLTDDRAMCDPARQSDR